MDIGSSYRRSLEERLGREPGAPPGGAGASPPLSPDVDVLLEEALREVEVSRRTAESTLAAAREQASRAWREARREARGLLTKARARADRLEECARSRAAAVAAAARDEGLLAGREAARAEAEALCRPGLEALERAAAALAGERDRFLSESGDRVVALMLALVRRAVGALDRSLEELLRRNLALVVEEHFRADERVVVRLNPADLDRVERSLAADVLSQGRVELRADPALEPGSARLWSGERGVAFSFDERLDALEREVRLAAGEGARARP